MKKFAAFFMAVLTAVSLCACGGSGNAQDKLTGTYNLYAMDYDENHIVLTDALFDGENYITLRSGGAAEMCLENEKNNVQWKADGEKITVSASDGDLNGTISNGILSLEADGSKLYFIGEGASKESLKAVTLDELLAGAIGEAVESGSEIPETEAVEPESEEELPTEPMPEETKVSSEPTDVQKMWNGWYYGCIDVDDCTGEWESLNGETFDAVLYVELGSDNAGKFAIWDPFGDLVVNEHSNKYVEGECHADTSYLYADSGTAFGDELYLNDWVFVHNTEIPEKIHVGSDSVRENGDKVGYDFQFKPWNDTWEGDNYTKFIPRFSTYIEAINAGVSSPFGDTFSGFGIAEPVQTEPKADTPEPEQETAAQAETKATAKQDFAETKLDVNDRGIVSVTYPDGFVYDDMYGKLKNESTGVGILIDPMLGATNFDELKASYEENNSDEENYSLVETTVNGYKALILKYSDWLGATMRVDVDFGGEHDGWYGISFAVSGDALSDCDTDDVWNVINSMELNK